MFLMDLGFFSLWDSDISNFGVDNMCRVGIKELAQRYGHSLCIGHARLPSEVVMVIHYALDMPGRLSSREHGLSQVKMVDLGK